MENKTIIALRKIKRDNQPLDGTFYNVSFDLDKNAFIITVNNHNPKAIQAILSACMKISKTDCVRTKYTNDSIIVLLDQSEVKKWEPMTRKNWRR